MWQSVIDSWYSGRLFNLQRAGQKYQNSLLGAGFARRVQKRLIKIFSGQAVDDAFNLKVFEWLISLGSVLRKHDDLAVV